MEKDSSYLLDIMKEAHIQTQQQLAFVASKQVVLHVMPIDKMRRSMNSLHTTNTS